LCTLSAVRPMSHMRLYCAILSRNFIAQLYRATKSPYATAHVATATNRINKHVLCATFRLYDPSSQTGCANCKILSFFLFLSSSTELALLICNKLTKLLERISSSQSTFVWFLYATKLQCATCTVTTLSRDEVARQSFATKSQV